MTNVTTEVQVAAKSILATAFGLAIEEIPDSASIDTFDPWDSLGHVQIIVALEKVIGRQVETEEILQLADLEDLQCLLDRAA